MRSDDPALRFFNFFLLRFASLRATRRSPPTHNFLSSNLFLSECPPVFRFLFIILAQHSFLAPSLVFEFDSIFSFRLVSRARARAQSSFYNFFFIPLTHPQSHLLSQLHPFLDPSFLFLPLICLFPHFANPLFRPCSLRLSLSFTHRSRLLQPLPSPRFISLLFFLTPAATFSNFSRCFAILDFL